MKCIDNNAGGSHKTPPPIPQTIKTKTMQQVKTHIYSRTFPNLSQYLLWDKIVNKGKEVKAHIQVNQFNVVVKFK